MPFCPLREFSSRAVKSVDASVPDVTTGTPYIVSPMHERSKSVGNTYGRIAGK